MTHSMRMECISARRGAHNRGGRGGSRTATNPPESPKMINYVQILQRPRQSSPSYIRNNRGRAKDNRMANLSSNGGILGNLVKTFGLSVSGDAVDDNGNALNGNGNYYLHKKFKKLTTTTAESLQGHGEDQYFGQNGLYPNESPISNSLSINLDLKKNPSQQLPGTLINNDFTSSIEKMTNNQKKNGVISESTIKSSTSVYKPKFRLSGAGELNMISSSSSDPIPTVSSNSQASAPLPPARITGDRRLDRQSLDDRISKIIDENQSILSTWPEHLSKRLKSQTQGHGQNSKQFGGSQLPSLSPSLRNGGGTSVNPLLMMSGGSTTEITPTINSARTFVFDGRSLDSPASASALDLCNSPALSRKKFSFDNTSMSSIHKYNMSETGSLQSDATCGVGDLSDSSSATSSSQFVVPKKRRRLSPPSSSFCGGEVSERPVKKHCPTPTGIATSGFQDVDVTVRGNCGPSGAKVTIRTNGASSNLLQAQAQVMEFARIIEENGGNSSGSSGSSSTSFKNRNLSSAPTPITEGSMTFLPAAAAANYERDFIPLDLNAKSGKSKPKAQRKRKQLEVVDLGPNVSAPNIPAKLASAPSDFRTIKDNHVFEKFLNGKNGFLRTDGMTISIDNEGKNQLGLRVIQDFEIAEVDKHLLIQTSAPNPKRPTFLALKPMNPIPKALSEPPGVLPSPDTPRGAKSYNQMPIDGSAYTYLGFKVSTRPIYTCLFKPQPMFINQETDPKLSMYSNWQAHPRDPKAGDVDLSTNNSSINGRKSPHFLYVSAKGKNSDVTTINSPDGQSPRLFTPTESERAISNTNSEEALPSRFSLPKDPMPSSSLASPPFSSTSKLVSNYKYENQVRVKQSSPSPMDQGNSSSSSDNSINKPNPIPCYRVSKYHHSGSKKKLYRPEQMDISSSESSSADESNYRLSKSEFIRRGLVRKDVDGDDQHVLRLHSTSNDEKDPASSDFNTFDNRVKVMEGGFESNEDYTYIRGRGRGRYVCNSCGIRCKKPSMLRKHLKTHTDLRPYMCTLCNFSFKTKGNLTKHQKSKSHHKKCVGLGIHPNSSRSLAMSGPIFDNNNTSDEDDSIDEDDDIDNENGGDSDSNNDDDGDGEGSPLSDTDPDHFEKEIAQSLLDLSHLSRFPRSQTHSESSENSPKLHISSPLDNYRGSPISKDSTLQNLKVGLEVDTEKNVPKQSTSVEGDAPMDLSVKCKSDNNIFSKRSNGVVKAMGIVGEAQRWEPEEAFLMNGILNLKKVRNTVIPQDTQEDSSEEITIEVEPEAVVPIAIPDIKVEKNDSAAESETGNGFEYEIKKKFRPGSPDLATSSLAASSEQCSQSESPKPSVSSGPSNGLLSCVSQNQRARLHQPWLSPQGGQEESPELTSRRERTESLNSCITGESSNSESTGCRDEIESGVETNALELSPEKSKLSEKTVGVCSPNSNLKSFSSLISGKSHSDFRQPNGSKTFIKDEGKSECNTCGKTFTRASQLTLHMNIHLLERPFRCDPCGVSFRTKGHLIKHRRSSSHDCKVYLTEAWGVANEENPRPFKCPDCKIAFRIHGHLAKHLRSKMHIMRMECLGKLPFGIYFEMEKSGLNLNEIDTTDCDMSLVSLQNVAKKIYGDTWTERLTLPIEEPV